jgi:hypothetical protein
MEQWKSAEDALNWACAELPAHSPEWLKQQFELQPDAASWVRFVEDLKANEFAGDPKPREKNLVFREVENSYAWGLAYRIGGKR